MTPIVRPGGPADVDRLEAGWRALAAWGHTRDPRFRLREGVWHARRDHLLATAFDGPWPHMWLAEDQGALVAYLLAGGGQNPLLDGPPIATVHDMWVEPPYRGRGVGRALVEAWRRGAQAGGAGAFEVGTLTLDADAVAFWQRMGFGPWRVVLRHDPTP